MKEQKTKEAMAASLDVYKRQVQSRGMTAEAQQREAGNYRVHEEQDQKRDANGLHGHFAHLAVETEQKRLHKVNHAQSQQAERNKRIEMCIRDRPVAGHLGKAGRGKVKAADDGGGTAICLVHDGLINPMFRDRSGAKGVDADGHGFRQTAVSYTHLLCMSNF